MWKFKGFRKPERFRLPGKPPAEELTQDALQLRAMRQIRLIAAAGAVLILADLIVSMTGASIPIRQEGGDLYLIRPAAGDSAGHIRLAARVDSADGQYEDTFEIRLDPVREKGASEPSDQPAAVSASAEDLVGSELRQITAGLNEDLTSRKVLLPSALSGGQRIHWSRKTGSNALLLLCLCAGSAIVIYRGRFRPLQRRDEARRACVRRQLPLFLNELVLMLGAGLVLTRAFRLAAERGAGGEEDYFRSNLRRICLSMQNTNGSLHEELRSFAKSSGVNELIRVSNIISDNINKGAELTRKLETESESLWLARKLHAEERGRIAETKMTLPLSVFLCVLIIITVAPALLQL